MNNKLLTKIFCLIAVVFISLNAQAEDYGTVEIWYGSRAEYFASYVDVPHDYRLKSWSWSTSNNNIRITSRQSDGCYVEGVIYNSSSKLTFTAVIESKYSLVSYNFVTSYTVNVIRPVDEISIKPTYVTLNKGETKQLEMTISPADATYKSVTWSSSKPDIAEVSSNGVVTAKKNGLAMIFCEHTKQTNKYAYCDVKVVDNSVLVSSISLNYSSLSMTMNEEKQLTATVSPSNATDKGVEWSCSPTGIVSLSANGTNATVKAISKGSTTITCKAKDGSGVKSTCSVSVAEAPENKIYINAVNFPDANFRTYLLETNYGKDGVISSDEIVKVENIDVKEKNIKDLKGIEFFTALKWFDCDKNQLTTLDVSKNIDLLALSCNENQLTTLDVSKNTALIILSCGQNQLTTLNVSSNTELTGLYCYLNQLTSLDVSKNTALTTLLCPFNQLTTLDVSKNTALTGLWCDDNQLTTLDVSRNTALTELECYRNQIKGQAMDKLVNSLPRNTTKVEHNFKVFSSYVGNDGNICTPAQVAIAKSKGWRVLYWAKTYEWLDYDGYEEEQGTKGDVNGDGTVNGTDLVALTNIILRNTKTDAADVNGDKAVNGTDYVALANIILRKSNAKRRASANGGATSLSIEKFNIQAGETKEMVINLSNPQKEVTLVQFDLRLPKGVSLTQTGGEYDIDIAGRTTWRKHSLDANATDGIIRFLLASSSNAVLSGTEGAIITMTLHADNSFGEGDISLENILMVAPDETETKQGTYTIHVGATPTPTPTERTPLSIEPLKLNPNDTKEMVIDLYNPDKEITLVQFDLRLPQGVSLKKTGGEYDIDIAGRTTWRKHSLDANATDGIIRFLLASSSNAVLSGTEGAIITMTLQTDNSYDPNSVIRLENILLVSPDETEMKPGDVEFRPVGIQGIPEDKPADSSVIYNLAGQRLTTPQRGVNIMGGKKVLVK